jgi:hypothetical protein
MYQPRLKHLLAAVLLATAAAAANAQDKGLHRLTSGGMDGNVRTYVAHCLDGTSGTVEMSGDSEQICAIAQGGQQRCDRAWTLMQAGQYACNAAGAR